MAESLGLDLSGPDSLAYGVGGEVHTVDTHVNIAIGNGHDRFTARLSLKAVLDPYEMCPLLGRRGFFEAFDILVREKKKRIELTKP